MRCSVPVPLRSPACGPLPVTTVPTTSTAAAVDDDQPGQHDRRGRATATRPACPDTRHHSSTVTAMIAIDEQEVQRDDPRVEVGQHGDPAEHRLRRDAGERERGEREPAVAAARRRSRVATAMAAEHERQRPVGELDQAVERVAASSA